MLVLAGIAVVPFASAGATLSIAQQIAVPAYINPTADPATWIQLVASAPGAVGIAVANVLNGPNYAVDPAWASVLQLEHAAGTDVLGYVDTGYFGTTGLPTRLGSTSIADWTSQIESDVNAWYTFYGPSIGGIFLDEAQNACGPTAGSDAWSDLYAQITAYVKRNHPGARVVINPGATVPQCYENSADTIVTFEGSYDTYTGSSYPALSWTPSDPQKIWHIIYDVPDQTSMESVIALSKERDAGYVFATNDTLPNPYDTLPPAAYWSDEQVQVAPGGPPGTTAPTVPSGIAATSVGGTSAVVSWTPSTAGSNPVAAYDIYENGAFVSSVDSSLSSYTVEGLAPSTSYSFTVLARDAYGNSSAQSPPLSVTTSAPEAAPTPPATLTASGTTFTSTTLDWSPSTDTDDSVAFYDVYANGTQVLSLPASDTTVTVGDLSSDGTAYSFEVTAEDASGSVSAPSNAVSIATLSLPGGLAVSSPTEVTNAATFTYSADYLLPFAFRRVFISTGTTPCYTTTSDPSICADYLIENDAVLKYAGNGTDFSFTTVDTVTPTVNGYNYTWTVPQSDLGFPRSQQDLFDADGYAPESYANLISGEPGLLLPGEYFGGSNPSEANTCLPCVDLSVDPATGDFITRSTDLSMTGRGPGLALTRSYDSAGADVVGPFGNGWTDSYAMTLQPDANLGASVMDVVQENGSAVDFVEQNGGTFVPPPRVFATLVHNADGTWTFTRKKTLVFTFNAAGQLIAESDLNGDTTTLSYSGNQLSTVTDAAGRTLQFTYDGSLVDAVTDSSGRTVNYTYDASGNLVSVTSATGAETTYGYPEGNLLTTLTKPDGGVTSNTYNAAAQVVTQSDALGNVTNFDEAADPTTMSGTTRVTDPEGIVTQYAFSSGELTAKTAAAGTPLAAATQYAYDPVTNEVTTITDPDGQTTTEVHDVDGNLTAETSSNGTTNWTYNDLDEVTSETPPATYGGQTATTTYIYDEPAYSSGGAGNLTTVSTPILSPTGVNEGTQVTHYLHADAAHPGDVTGVIGADGNTWTFGYDAAGDKISETAPSTSDDSDVAGSYAVTTRWDYNGLGEMTAALSGRYVLANPSATSCTTPATGCTAYTYDNAGHLLVTTDGDGLAVTRAYDGDGYLVSVRSSSGRTTTTYNAADQVVATRTARSSTTTEDYNPDGQVKDRTDAEGDTTSYTYDALGHLQTTTDDGGDVTNSVYDADGNLLASGDVDCTPTTPTPGCAVYAYNSANELVSTNYNDPNTPNVSDITYDGDGRRIATTDGSGTSTWSYDSLGRIVTTTNGAGATTAYAYDDNSNVTSITYPGSDGTVMRSYDNAGRLSSTTDWLNNTTTFAYDADNDLTITADPTTGSPVIDTATFDGADNITAVTVTSDGQTLGSFTRPSPVGQGRDLSLTASTTDAAAAGLDPQLTSLNGTPDVGGTAEDPAHLGGLVVPFDPAGLVVASTTADLYNAEETVPTTGPGAPFEAVPGRTYDYDVAGDLVATGPANGSGGRVTTYGYDADGLRTSKTTFGSIEDFTWDTVSQTSPDMIDDQGTAYLYGPDGAPLEQMVSGNVVWYRHDAEGSIRLITDATGSVVGRAYYGTLGTNLATRGVVTPLGFGGGYLDRQSGLVYLVDRYFDPTTGLVSGRQ